MLRRDLENIIHFAVENYPQNKSQHNIHHIKRVNENALMIADIVGNNQKIDRVLLSAACYLHDILIIKIRSNIFLSIYNYFFEKSINQKHIGDIVKRFNLQENDARILATAIINHSFSIPFRILNTNNDIYSKILQDADSLDYVSDERLEGFNNNRRLLSPISKSYISLIRKNIRYFLNFPEVSKMLKFSK